MNYRNAQDILPDKLLKQLQKYTSGELLYVPAEEGRKKWGSNSGAKQFYETRNEEIRYRYFHKKQSIESIAEDFSLSYETIRKILYR